MEMHITVITIIIQFIMSTRQNAPYSFATISPAPWPAGQSSPIHHHDLIRGVGASSASEKERREGRP